ncbi:hypothetical protein LEP1GSC161_2104 [Leptospira santarosai str. CBC1416]|uniref:Uncharacterized protein n=1 Tax=Leptospira santarosai str. CBC1416 TaxID=1193059 RepID=M6VSV5_9LEPT|nr:hypothetical protein LEP1GSC163_3369 [Leptospira santarosai str. CBC379]EMO56144.1 hypothetical protein LEP1GSC161_2104 [Leptospira santarosai str. CBC1416]
MESLIFLRFWSSYILFDFGIGKKIQTQVLKRAFDFEGYKKRGRCNFRPPVHFKMKIRSGRTQPGRLLSIH